MSTAIAPTNGADVMERVITSGDLSKLNAGDRIAYYFARCEAAGLDSRAQPFQYLQLQGKLTLYATKAATDQLIAQRKLTVEIIDRGYDRELGIYGVRCRVTFGDGHHVEDYAAMPVHGLKGELLCNALMKCVTKAKRRTVLSACGLGMLDETEVETIPGAKVAPVEAPEVRTEPPETAGRRTEPRKLDAPTSPNSEAVLPRSWRDYVQERIDAINVGIAFACDDAKIPQVVLTAKEGKPVNIYQVGNHLIKAWVQAGAVAKEAVADKLQKSVVLDQAWQDFPDDFIADVEPYLEAERKATLRSVGVAVDDQWEEGRE